MHSSFCIYNVKNIWPLEIGTGSGSLSSSRALVGFFNVKQKGRKPESFHRFAAAEGNLVFSSEHGWVIVLHSRRTKSYLLHCLCLWHKWLQSTEPLRSLSKPGAKPSRQWNVVTSTLICSRYRMEHIKVRFYYFCCQRSLNSLDILQPNADKLQSQTAAGVWGFVLFIFIFYLLTTTEHRMEVHLNKLVHL